MSSLKLIPTPQKARFIDGNLKIFSQDKVYTVSIMEEETEKLRFAAQYLKKELEDKFGLHFNIKWRQMPVAEEDIVIYCNPELDKTQLPTDLDFNMFAQDYASEQGYIVMSAPENPIYVCAQSDQGILYGIATLIQLCSARGDGASLPNILVEDYPQYRYRGNRWLLKVECGVWGYDWGDGIGAYRDRIIEKLNMAMQYKVNVIIFDGFGWGLDVFPEYADLMRELNREARLRGIHLLHSGYGAGIGGGYRDKPDFYRGPILENRKEYPDGEIYHCIAGERYCGTCLSNESLMDLRLEGLRKFVAEVEPGALYIHQQDEGLTPETWVKRCPECRKMWPSDEITTENGMAGAYAYLYNRMIAAVKSVRNDAYSADEDCLIMLVSPGYLSYGLDDDGWKIGLKYWSTLSRLLEHRDKVYPGFREIFINHTDNLRRAPQLKEALSENGEEQNFGIIYFYGADGHHNDKLFLSAPVLNYIFEGVEMLATSCGHSYSEPLQLLNAEYMWNPHGSDFFTIEEKPDNYKAFKKLYFECQYSQFKPEGLYNDFLKTACIKLYGEPAGNVMHEMFLIEGKNHEAPIPYLDNSGLIRGDMVGAEAEGGGRAGSVFKYFSWPCPDHEDKKAIIRERIKESLAATVKAAEVLKKGLENDAITGSSREYLRWYATSLVSGIQYVGYLEKYVDLVDSYGTGQAAAISDRIQSLLCEVAESRAHNTKSRMRPVDYLRGTLSGRDEIINFVESNLKKMLATEPI